MNPVNQVNQVNQGISAFTVNQIQRFKLHSNVDLLHQAFSVGYLSFGEGLSLSPPKSSIEAEILNMGTETHELV